MSLLFFYNQVVPAGETATSDMWYIGTTNSSYPTLTIPTQNLFVKMDNNPNVQLQVAVTNNTEFQIPRPLNADFIPMTEPDGTPINISQNTIRTFNSLNGLWVRAYIDNSEGISPATVTVQLAS